MDRLKTAFDVLAFVYVLLVFPAAVYCLTLHVALDCWRRMGGRSLWFALPIWGVCDAAMLLFRHPLFAERFGRNGFTSAVGFILLILAAWLEVRTRRELGLRRLVGLAEVGSPSSRPPLVVTGIYAKVRHPRYLGYLLGWLGVSLLAGAYGILGLAILSFLLYLMVARLEEKELEEYYGPEYSTYARAVPRFIPRWRRKARPCRSPHDGGEHA
jgi:protein-S-isoprenylcysteine O-methyltransferase Ste14